MKFQTLSKQQKIYIVGGTVFIGIMLWAFIYANILTHGFSRSDVSDADKQKIQVSDIILTETKNNIKYWEIYSETGQYDNNDKAAILNRVIGNFYKDNEVYMSFESQMGTYNETLGHILLHNNVYIALKDNTTLKCDELLWAGSDKDIIASGNVKINRNNELKSTGERVIISPDYSKFRIENNTRTELYREQEK